MSKPAAVCPDMRGQGQESCVSSLGSPLEQWGQRGAGLALLVAVSWVKGSHHTRDFLFFSPGVKAEVNNLLPGVRCGHYRIKQRGDTGSFCHLGLRWHLPPCWFCDDQLPFVPQHAQTCLCICLCPFPFLFLHPLALGRAGVIVVPQCPSAAPPQLLWLLCRAQRPGE